MSGAFILGLMACGTGVVTSETGRQHVLDDTAGEDSAPAPDCPDGDEMESRQANDAEGLLDSIGERWYGAGFASGLYGQDDGSELLAWGIVDEARISLFEGRSFSGTPSPDPAWTMMVPSPDDDPLYVRSATAEGDFTGDGQTDLVVATSRDELLLFLGPVDGTTRPGDAFLQVRGEGIGTEHARVGDMDGDGVSELATGIYGAVVLLSPARLEGDVLLWDAGPMLEFGDERSEEVPRVASAGDHDGDGLADFLVSSRSWSGLYIGPPASGDEGEAEALFDGEGALGWRTGGSGDFNGDGHPDVLVGARESDGAGIRRGRAWVVYGPASGPVDLAEANAYVTGTEDYLNLGSALASAGDVDGDGFDELLISAAAADCDVYGGGSTSCNTGSPVVYRFRGPLSGNLDLACSEVSWEGDGGTIDHFGREVRAAVDLNGSGRSDMVVSSSARAFLFLDP
ncbi:MAG: VCBS repeat-containing protein [Pseudomonadota bacterium]|nr:VCBS repeat-containing protein [Pseudomonadota bacterium]